MTEPRTHYQVTFSARQGVLFFAVLLGALAGAYFLGIATGVSGRPRGEPAPAAGTQEGASPSPTAVSAAAASEKRQSEVVPSAVPTRAPEPRATAPAIAAREPSSAGGIQFFEDRPEEAGPTPTPAGASAPKKAGASPPALGGFWIQVLSTASENEAKARRTRLAASGYRAAVSPVRGPKGPTLYRVRIGPYGSREEASKASEGIVRKERVRTWIVPPGD